MFKYIQNLDKVLVDLKRTRVTIARTNSQFCYTSIKIVGFICDANECYSDISKILKMFDWLEYTDVILACAFIGVGVYYRI